MLVEGPTGRPVNGALMVLLDRHGAQRAGALTDTAGRFVVRAPEPGLYTLRAERIGYASTYSQPFNLAEGQTIEQHIAATMHAVNLEGIHVVARRRCILRPEEGTATHQLWEEAQKALNATAWTQRQGLFRFRIMDYHREISLENGRVRRESATSTSRIGSRPFRSLSAAELAEGGYVQDTLYYAPDADVLLSDVFRDSYCFRLAHPGKGQDAGLIGLAFEPVNRPRRPDIRGVLWLERATAELRYLEYRYTDLRLDGATEALGGRVEFHRLPTGSWIVSRWQIRTPVRAVRIRNDRWRPAGGGTTGEFVTAIWEREGVVAEVLAGSGYPVHRALSAALHGVVFDSTRALPLAGATVFLAGTDYNTRTDAEGRFQIEELPEGTYSLEFLHPRLDSLGISSPTYSVTLIHGRTSNVTPAIPSPGSILLAQCTSDARAGGEGAGVLHGVVWNASSGVPLPDARVLLSWDASATTEGRNQIEARTDMEGRYRVCGVPMATSFQAQADFRGRVSDRTELRLQEDNTLPYDFQIRVYTTVGQIIGGPTLGASRQPVRVVGRLLDAETAELIVGAQIRLIGTNHQSRRSRTDRKGHFVFADVIPHLYSLEISHPHYDTHAQRIAVGSGGDIELEFRLLPKK
jgi:hypothetical protein